ncbi:GNAT family N-acetyltransferase [Cognatishimia maritima]|uniref:L-ornithine N(alpha)-acyltransferase n=1 Tax=Cognatishimia maritima TaxID=870908 RepID=A0A1M5IVY9_9RHOB|nr:GNAT family N-acetyltransferase [Cognatishimia maritima]SHG32464.1 ornithine-acyl[acyl carrier protein] N-acyltransferase [Cognatishimia maritima]
MVGLKKGRYVARLAETESDIRAAQKLRHLAFHGTEGLDADDHDVICTHILVEDRKSGQLVCCFRMLPLATGNDISQSYSSQFYELSALEAFEGSMVEMGRFCIHPEWHDPDILRVAWAAMTGYVDENNVEMLFGCSSFKGTDTDPYLDSFAFLRDRHQAPKRWLPRIKAPKVFQYAKGRRRKPDLKRAQMKMPPLLRTYLMMGGWVSDHAVVDHEMNTLHVFTGLEIKAIPPARKRLLRAMSS